METCNIIIKDVKIDNALLAISKDDQERGLMGVEPPTPVMVFAYSRPSYNAFWMRATPAPLDIVFCVNDKISSIWRGEPFSTKIIGGHDLSDLVIELPSGTCEAYGIKAGDSIKLECFGDSLMKIFMLKNGFVF